MNDLCPGFLCETQWLQDNLTRADLRIIESTYFLEFSPSGQALLTCGRKAWQAAHIPNSIYLDLLTELSDPTSALPFMMPPPDHLSRVMAQWGIDSATQVVIYDRQGSAWATRLWWMLRVCGFDRAMIVNGGWLKWQAEHRPVSTAAAPMRPATTFIVHPRPHLFVDRQTVVKSMGQEGIAIICALGREVYAKGHIPGSLNVPAADLLDPRTETFLPVDQLEARFHQAGISRSQRIITYCGGGIASTGVAFALTLLGFDQVAVYDGSMEDWRRDPTLPVERG